MLSWLAIGLLGLAAPLGCGSSDTAEDGARDLGTRPARAAQASPTDFDAAPSVGQLPSQVWPREQYYRNALALMSNVERLGFFEQTSDYKRDLYLREIGADARLDMHVMLRPGMSLEEVQARFANETWDREPVRYGFSEVYGMKRFNGRGYTRMLVTLLGNELETWNTYSDQQWQRDEAIQGECMRLDKELGRFLEKGMSQPQLRNHIATWPVQSAQVYLTLADTSQFRESRETWETRVRRREFEARLDAMSLLARRVYPNAQPNSLDYYEREWKQPDAVRFEVTREYWRYDLPFGNRRIWIWLVWDEAVLIDWYVEPMPDTVDVDVR